MKVGIIGPAGSGKTTLFNALTGTGAQVGGARKTHLAAVKVPDPRLEKIAELAGAKKSVPAEIIFSDPAGRLSESETKRGIEPKLLNIMQAEDAFAMVLADFDDYVSPSGNGPDPLKEAWRLENELALSDLVIIEEKLDRMKKENAKGLERDTLEKCRAHLEKDMPLRTLDLNREELKAASSYSFLSLKNALLIRNTGENKLNDPQPEGIREFAEKRNLRYMSMPAKLQMEIEQMEPEERQMYARELGLEGTALELFLRETFALLDLVTFFTVGGPSREAHAWNIKKGTPAPEAAGKVHSDMKRGFIRAEVISYDDFVECAGEAGAKKAGKVRLEGKDYIVRDGDVIFFRFNV